MVVQGQGPGPRYGHVMDLVAQRYLVTVSGNDGEGISVLFYLCDSLSFCSLKVINCLMLYYLLLFCKLFIIIIVILNR